MSAKNERMELIQVAAVAAASLENMDYGQAQFDALVEVDGVMVYQGPEVLRLITKERAAQDGKWSTQEHGRIEWAMILTEEIGEWAEELLEFTSDELSEAEQIAARGALTRLSWAGIRAREWLEAHDWLERQQKVFDEEAHAKEGG